MRGLYWKSVVMSTAYLFGVQLLLPFLSPYFSSLGYSDSVISIILAIFPLTVFFVASSIGELSQEIGRSWTIKLGLLISMIAYFLYFWGFGPALIVARIIDAIAYVAVTMLLFAKAQDAMSDGHRGSRTGVLLSIQTAMRLLAPMVGGYLADKYIGYPFFLSVAIFGLLALSLRHKHLHQKAPIKVHPLKNIKWFVSHKQLFPMALLGPFMHALQPIFLVILPLYLVNELGLSYASVGVATAAFTVGSLLQFFIGDLSDRVGRRKLIIAGTSLKILSLLYIALFTPSYVGLLIALLIYGVGGATWNVTAWAYMSDIAEQENMEGLMIGTYTSISQVGLVISFVLVAVLLSSLSYLSALLVVSLIGLFGVLLSAAYFRHAYALRSR